MGLLERSLSVLMMCMIVSCIMPVHIPSAQTPPPANGDWTIYDTTVISDTVIDLKGNLTVNETGSLTLNNVTLVMNQTSSDRVGIYVDDGGTLVLEGCDITTAGPTQFSKFHVWGALTMNGTLVENLYGWANTGGVSLESTMGVIISNSTIRNAMGNGISVNHTYIDILDCDFYNISRMAIQIENWGLMSSRVLNNTMHDADYGVRVGGLGSSQIHDNHIYDCLIGISVQTDIRSHYISNNNVHDNMDGIQIGYNMEGTIHDNIVTNNTRRGIYFMAQSDVVAYDNVIINNSGVGVSGDYRNRFVLQNNTIKNNAKGGALLEKNASMEAYGNIFENNTPFEIRLTDNSKGDIHDNIISTSPEFGIKLEVNASAVIRRNEISDTVKNGINLFGKVSADIIDNIIYHPTLNGIQMASGANATIQGNTIRSGDNSGIEYLGSLTKDVNLHVLNNTITTNEAYGIRIMNAAGSNISIIGNDISIHPKTGLYISGTASTTISDNVLEMNSEGGMEVNGGTHEMHGNTFVQNEIAAVTLFSVKANISYMSVDASTLSGTTAIVAPDCDLDIENTYIKWSDVGLDLDTSSAFVRNSTWESTSTDIRLAGETDVLSYNNTIDESGLWFEKDAFPSEYRVIWYPDMKVVDSKGRPLAGANVNITTEGKVITLDDQGEAFDVIMSGYSITKADGRVDLEHTLVVGTQSPVVDEMVFSGISVGSDAGIDLDFDFAPVLSLPVNISVVEEEELVIDLASNVTDHDHALADLDINTSSQNIVIRDGEMHIYYGSEVPGGKEDVVVNITDGVRSRTYHHTVLLEAVNDVPIVTVPNVINVTEDVPYELDLEPLIYDEEGDDIIIVVDSDYVRSISYLLTFEYPAGMTGEVFNLSISDGPNVLVIPIRVNVIHINLPPTIDAIPPPKVFEDIEATLDLGAYIHDEDDPLGDLIIDFMNTSYVSLNGTVLTMLYPEGVLNDTIIFSVSDGKAEAWGSISVQVTSVDDPPQVQPIPQQKVVPGESYTLDLSHYITDIDTPLDDVKVTSTHRYVKIAGKELTIKYPEGYTKETDRIELVIQDFTTKVPVEIDVTIKVSTSKTVVRLEDYSYQLFLIVPLAIILTAVGFYMYRRIRYEWAKVRDVFLIFDDGRLLAHKGLSEDMDKDIFGGMLTAVQQFVNDSLEGVRTGSLKEFEYEDLKIAIERGNRTYLALFLEGHVTDKLRKRMKSTLDDVDDEYGTFLTEWDGDFTELKDIGGLLDGLVTEAEGQDGHQEYPDPDIDEEE